MKMKISEKEKIVLLQAFAGGASGAFTKTATAPLERLKILHQTGSGKQLNPGICYSLVQIYKKDGFVGFFRGNGANVFRIVPVYAVKFASNDAFKEMVRKPGQDIKHLNMNQLMLSGTAAGFIQILSTYPLEVIRTRLALSSNFGGLKYNGIIDCATKSIKQEGIRSMYKGLPPTLVSGVPYVALQMTSYDVFKNFVDSTLLAGALAGIFSQTLTYPGDTVRRCMQTNFQNKYANAIDCAKKLIKTEGLRGLFRGFYVNTVRSIPGAAIQFSSYDYLKKSLNC